MRPFGISTLMAGFKTNGAAGLFLTEPSGIHTEWKANAVGNGSKTAFEYLEKNWSENMDVAAATQLALKGLLEVVEPNSKALEVAIMTKDGAKYLTEQELETMVKSIEDAKKAAEEAKEKEKTK